MSRLPASSLPTLRQLQFLTALRAEGSFGGAADAVGVTQPTLSAGIKELEAALGAVLVERASTGAVMTPAGEEAAERGARALAEVEELVRAVHAGGKPLHGRFRVGAIPTIAPFLLPRALPLLAGRFPHLRLAVREDTTARLLDALRARTLDAAIIALPYAAPGIATAPVAEDEFLLLCPSAHPLAARNSLSPEDLRSEDLLLLEDGHCLREHALSVCSLPRARNATDVAATSLHTLVQLVAGGMGVTLLPKLAADSGAALGAPVAVRSFSAPAIGRSIAIAWREGSPREVEGRLLAEVLRELF